MEWRDKWRRRKRKRRDKNLSGKVGKKGREGEKEKTGEEEERREKDSIRQLHTRNDRESQVPLRWNKKQKGLQKGLINE